MNIRTVLGIGALLLAAAMPATSLGQHVYGSSYGSGYSYGRTGYGRGYGYGIGLRGGYGYRAGWGGGYWNGAFWPRAFYGWSYPLYLGFLPALYSAYWWGGVPYYYVNHVYYNWSAEDNG